MFQQLQHQPSLSHPPIVPLSQHQPSVGSPSWVQAPVPLVSGMQPPLVVQQYYQPPAQMPIVVCIRQHQRSFLLRVLWYVCIGSWLGFCWLVLGYVLCVTVVLLPIGLFMLNRLPTILTLRPQSEHSTVAVSNGAMRITVGAPPQRSFLLRTVYFVLIGWWLAGIWALLGFVFCWLIVTVPLGLLMLNRLPAILTLRRN